MKARLITILVDAPKPLSITFDGIVSSIAFGVAQIKTPQVNPNKVLPIHVRIKFGRKLIRVDNNPIKLK